MEPYGRHSDGGGTLPPTHKKQKNSGFIKPTRALTARQTVLEMRALSPLWRGTRDFTGGESE